MGMAYSHARGLISGCERSLGFALTNRKVGGASGGGSQVTTEAVELMRKHEALCAEAEEAIGKIYKKHFGQPAQVQVYTAVPRKWRRERQG